MKSAHPSTQRPARTTQTQFEAAALPTPAPTTAGTELPLVPEIQSTKTPWNTKNMGFRMASDAISGVCAAALVAPIIAAVDKAIMQNASGQATLKSSILASLRALALRPHALVLAKPFAFIVMVYGGTYFTANSVDTLTSTIKSLPASHTTSGTSKFAASSAANVGLCLIKDRAFVRMFGPSGPARAVPMSSFALFTLRDCLTIFASFNVPSLLGPAITRSLSAEIEKNISGKTIAQFLAPAGIQLVSTPMHLLGLDLYNRPAKLAWSDRVSLIRKNWGVSSLARICRIVPAFGVGGVVNNAVRQKLMKQLE